MSHAEPIRINVDVTNPGQFFACCGLLELADRLCPGAEGWFEHQEFCVDCVGELAELLQALIARDPEQVTTLDDGLPVQPLIAPLRLSIGDDSGYELTLDAWMTIKRQRGKPVATGNPPWNFWSGQQTSFGIWRDLRRALKQQLTTIEPQQLRNLFTRLMPLSGRFGFDPGAAWNALDVGFSPNEQGMTVASSPAVELLAAVGIQRFQPRMAEDRQSFVYATWRCPLSPSVAAAAVSGAIVVVRPNQHFRARVVTRGSYAALERANPSMEN